MVQCPKCKSKIFNNYKYCIMCGNIFDKEYFLKSEEFDIERKLIKEIVGYDKFNECFSKKYLIFNFIYAFYMKMYFVGMVSFICVAFLKYITNYERFLQILIYFKGSIFCLVLFGIFFSILILGYYVCNFDRIYFDKVFLKVCNITKSNKNLEFNELKKLCKKEFKPNIILSIISAIVFIILITY